MPEDETVERERLKTKIPWVRPTEDPYGAKESHHEVTQNYPVDIKVSE